MHHPRPTLYRVVVFVAGLALIGCDFLGDPKPGTKAVSFSVSTSEAIASSVVAFARNAFDHMASASSEDGPLFIGAGTDTLRIDSVRIVLAQVTLGRVNSDECGASSNDDAKDANCATLSTGPFIQKLPLTSGALSLFDVPVEKGSYGFLTVRVHKPNRSDSGPNMQAFLDANPTWENISIRVDGAFNGAAVHWNHDPVVQLQHKFDPPLEVTETNGTNFTLKVDVASWFKAANGSLIDPNAKTNVQYPQIALNVKNSFKVFKDDKRSGHDDAP